MRWYIKFCWLCLLQPVSQATGAKVRQQEIDLGQFVGFEL